MSPRPRRATPAGEGAELVLVEDNQTDAELILRSIRAAGVHSNVLILHDGEQVLDYLFKRGQYAGRGGDQPVAVFLDLKMPRIDGIDVLRAVRANEATRTIPMIVMTSSREHRDIQACYALGVNSFLSKPVEFDRLVDMVTQACRYWLHYNQPPD